MTPEAASGAHWQVEAPAKVNLDLRVVGRRADGHHLLDSTVVLLELADSLRLVSGAGGLVVSGDPSDDVPRDATNLAWRGLLAGLSAETATAALELHKRIPSAAGLGGGSSDAAAAWRLGRAATGRPDDPSADDITQLVAIGADVPFFAAGAPAARLEGVGERLTPVPAPSLDIVLTRPPLRLRTSQVFAELRQGEWGSGTNDLLAPALRICPPIGELFALVAAAGGNPRLSGSGPTVFAALDDPERARDIAARLARAGVSATVTRTRRAAASIQRTTEEE